MSCVRIGCVHANAHGSNTGTATVQHVPVALALVAVGLHKVPLPLKEWGVARIAVCRQTPTAHFKRSLFSQRI